MMTLIERKLRIPQIQGVQGRMPFAAASKQPSTASFGMLLCTQEPEIGVSCCSAESPFQPNSRFPQRWRIPTIDRDSLLSLQKAYLSKESQNKPTGFFT